MIPHDKMKAEYDRGCADTIERIAVRFERMADDYLPLNNGQAWDIWEWTAELARRLRAGEFTKPLDTTPPF